MVPSGFQNAKTSSKNSGIGMNWALKKDLETAMGPLTGHDGSMVWKLFDYLASTWIETVLPKSVTKVLNPHVPKAQRTSCLNNDYRKTKTEKDPWISDNMASPSPWTIPNTTGNGSLLVYLRIVSKWKTWNSTANQNPVGHLSVQAPVSLEVP